MRVLIVALLIVAAAADAAHANWRLYHKDREVAASFDYLSRSSYRNHPAVWVRWHYGTPRNGVGGAKLLFSADCATRRLYEVEAHPYDTGGSYLPQRTRRHPNAPQEYSVTPGSLNEATYRLLCP